MHGQHPVNSQEVFHLVVIMDSDQKQQLEHSYKVNNMVTKIKTISFVCLIYLCVFQLKAEKRDTLEVMYIDDYHNNIPSSDSNIIKLLHIKESSLKYDLSNVDKLHFLSFYYEGTREKFPDYKNKIVDLKKIEIIDPKLKALPNFIIYKNLKELIIETNQIEVKNVISECPQLEVLIYSSNKNKLSDMDEICKLSNLKELGFYTSKKQHLNSTNCLFFLTNLSSLLLNIDDSSIMELKRLPKLNKLTLMNKLSYKVAMENLELLKKYDRINLPIGKMRSSDLDKIKKILPNINWPNRPDR